jgi:nitroreductase
MLPAKEGRLIEMPIDPARLDMPIGAAMFSQRSIRRFRTDPISTEDLQLLLEAAGKAPSGGNRQPARFMVLTDPEVIRKFGGLYREAWWAKRRDEKRPWSSREEIPPEDRGSVSAARLADEIKDTPCIVLALTTGKGQATSVIPAVQNLMLAARALGIGSVPTTLHAQVMDRVHELLGIPAELDFHLCIPLGYPRGKFGTTQRRPTAETTYWNRWGAAVPWAAETSAV